MHQNPQSSFQRFHQPIIGDYIYQNLNLQCLKIKKFPFDHIQQASQRSYRNPRATITARDTYHNYINEQRQQNIWQPRLSHRKLNNDPKMVISLQRKKLKSADKSERLNNCFVPPKSRNGFRGEKVKNHSYIFIQPEEKIPKAFTIVHKQKNSKIDKKAPHLQFNFQYILKSRKKIDKIQKTMEEQTKTGSNKGYFNYFNSDSFVKNIQKNIFRPSTHVSQKRNKIIKTPRDQSTISQKL